MLRRALALTLGFAIMACASAPLPAGTPPADPSMISEADRSEIRAVVLEQAAAWNEGNLAGYMAGYWKSDELEFVSGDTVTRGWQATFDRYQARYATAPDVRASMGTLAFESLAVEGTGPGHATVTGRWILTRSANDGSGGFTLSFERKPEGWKIVRDHTTSDVRQ